jgi:hypothetical protein
MFSRCPKCGHRPLPPDQALPAACPACGVILAKLAQAMAPEASMRRRAQRPPVSADGATSEPTAARQLARLLLQVPDRVPAVQFWFRVALLAAFGVWGLRLIGMDVRTGEIGQSFIHGPLLVFHEAGHLVFGLFGEWVSVLGGTLAQLLMPVILGVALLWKNRDPFGAAIGLWLLGVSLLDVAPYMFDALDPQLILLSGDTGAAGGHDWIYLFSSMGLLQRAPSVGTFTHTLGALTVLLALGWAALVLKRQHARAAGGTRRAP